MFNRSIWRILYSWVRTENIKAQNEKQNSARESNPILKSCYKIGDQRNTEGCNESVDNICRSAAQADYKSLIFSVCESAPDAKNSDGTHRHSEQEPYSKAFEKRDKDHAEPPIS